MGTTGRRTNPSLIEKFSQQPYCFDFFQAVRLLERTFPSRLSIGRDNDSKREIVKFHSHISLTFPPSQIHKVFLPVESLESLESINSLESSEKMSQMVVAFMGLAGITGVLPTHYTEMLIERRRQKDHTLASFLDIFNHRLISLFYRAWEKYRFPVAYERGEEDYFTQYLFDTVGMGTRGLQNRNSFPDKALLLYSGLIGQKPHSATAIGAILSDFFQISATIQQLTGQWLKLDPESLTRLGKTNNRLGQDTVVGSKIWDQQSKFRLQLGPLTFEKFKEFLPIGSAYKPAIDLTRLLVGQELDFDNQLVLQAKEVPACKLTNKPQGAMLLGWTTWLKTKDFENDDMQVVLRTDSAYFSAVSAER
jgi:type VI secretion system protein ImpH